MNIFGKPKTESNIKRSKYFSDKLHSNRLITIDGAINILIRGSLIKVPSTTIVSDIDEVLINDDRFEYVKLSNRDRLLYDVTNDIFYYMCYHSNDSNRQNVTQDQIIISDNSSDYIFSSCTDVMESDTNELYRIYNRQIAPETDEYLFVIVDKNMTEHYWLSVILQPSMIG